VLVIAMAVLVAILVAAVGIVLIRTFADVADPGRTDGRGHRVTGTANGRGAATLDLVSGVSSVTGPEITATRPLQWPGDPQ